MKKLLILLLTFSLLLGLLSACTTPESSSESSSEPISEPTSELTDKPAFPLSAEKLIWALNDNEVRFCDTGDDYYAYRVYGLKLQAALELSEFSDALFSVAFHAEEAKPFLEEWKIESEPTVFVKSWGYNVPYEQLEGYSFAFLTKEQTEMLLENSAENAPFLYFPPCVEEYPENIGNDLVTMFEYMKPKEQYKVESFFGQNRFKDTEELTKEEIIDKAEGAKNITLSSCEDGSIDPYNRFCYVTPLENGELTNQTEAVQILTA